MTLKSNRSRGSQPAALLRGSKPPRVLLRGYFGQGNWGDELLLRALVEGLAYHQTAASRMHYWSGPSRAYDPPRIASSNPRSIGGLMAWLMAGEVIMSGGIFYDHLETNGTRRLRRLARLVRFMRAMGKRVIFFGVSIGPLTSPNGRLLTREILSHADGLWVRDALSVAFCREAGIECFHMPDLAAIFASRVAAMAACPTQEALFIPCGSGLDDGTHRRAIYTLQDTMRRYGLELKLLPIETRTDRPLAQRLSYQCGIPVAMKDESDPWRLMAHIKGARLVVSGRLHGGWGAYLCGRPLIQIDYHSKCRGLADSIHLPDPCLIDRRCDADDLRRAVALWLDSEEVHRPKLRAPEILENEVREAFGRLMIEMDSPGTNPKR